MWITNRMPAIIVAAMVFVMAWAAFARAADIPAKAPALAAANPCTVVNCSGFYAGVNLTGTMTNADVIGNGINGSIAAGGQSIGIQAGYQFWNGQWFFSPEVDANYVVNGNPNFAGVSPSRYRVGEYLKIGTQLANILGVSGPSSPVVPPALASYVISPYVLFGAVQSGIGQGWATGAGVEFVLGKNWFLDTRYTYVNYGSQNVAPAIVAKTENLVTVGFNYKFGR